MELAAVVATSTSVAATRSRTEKTALLADLLRAAGDEIALVVGLVAGDPRQGRVGVGWATIGGVAGATAANPTLTVTDLDKLLDEIVATHGTGSQSRRAAILDHFFSRATDEEASFVRRLLQGELRQGANAGIVTDAIARATDAPAALVRRATMLAGDLRLIAAVARTEGPTGLEAIGLELFRPIQPMLASTAKSVAEVIDDLGLASTEWKLDGIRIQVHRSGDEVRMWTRNLNEIDGLAEVADLVRAFPVESVVLDGEVLGIDADGSPYAFQDTVSNEARSLRPFFFDLLHLDGIDHLDSPLETRRAALTKVCGGYATPGVTSADPLAAQAVLDDALARGHEGVVVKAADSSYQAGRRGKTWRKVKPVHTLDLVVLAVEPGSGRREGWLSNIHLGARDPAGGFVMVGKTFKGMTDEMLRWQTERFRELAIPAEDGSHDPAGRSVVWVAPIQVVEIALDGVQRSTRYPGGVALRFARVVRYRDDKDAADADTIDTVRAVGG